MKSKPVEFALPAGFTLPEGIEPGEDFDLVCSLRLKPNGTLCLTRLGDTEMPGYDEPKERRPRYGEMRELMTGETETE